jgi:hypothetical protein
VAAGLTLRFDDFTLEMHSGTLYTSPATLGPTALLFVGEATVTSARGWRPSAAVRQFGGHPESWTA